MNIHETVYSLITVVIPLFAVTVSLLCLKSRLRRYAGSRGSE